MNALTIDDDDDDDGEKKPPALAAGRQAFLGKERARPAPRFSEKKRSSQDFALQAHDSG